jgi:hypothetical protein
MSDSTGARRTQGSTGASGPSGPSGPHSPDDEHRLDEIVRAGPTGTIAVAAIATFIVLAIWFAFYFLAFVPRGVIQ